MTINDEKEVDVNPRCFFDIEIGGVSAGRVVFEIFANQCPKTADNFRQLCTGEGGVGKTTLKPLHFKGTVFHRVIKDFMIQGGDFSNFNGTGGESIYGGTFEDENLQAKHDEPFLLSMANRGVNTNGSQFFILTQPAPHLNGLHVVFGKVVSGQPIIKQVEGLPVDRKSRPLSDVRVANCGELVLLKKKKEKKPKKDKKEKELKKSEEAPDTKEDEEEGERSSGEISESGSEGGKKKKDAVAGTIEDENEEVSHPLVSLRNIDPEDIPKDPSNRFLNRNKLESDEKDEKDGKEKDKDKKKRKRSGSRSKSRSKSPNRDRRDQQKDKGDLRPDDRSRFGNRQMDNEGRKIKGRGKICFPRFTSRSRSKTPPHWKAETRKTISMKEFEEREKKKRDRDDELHRRQEERKKRHEETVRPEPNKNKERPREREVFSSMRHRLERRESDRQRERPKEASSLRSRFQPADQEKSASREPEPKTKTPDFEQSTKIVDELASKLQAAGDGVVYYQHLYKGSTSTTANDNPDPNNLLAAAIASKNSVVGVGAVEFDAQKGKRTLVPDADDEEEGGEDEDEGPPGEEDESVLAELRLRRELLKKRLKDWEEDSDDGNKEQSNGDRKLQSAVEAELKALNEKEGISEDRVTKSGARNDRKNSKSKSVSKSRSRSKSKSKSRDRRDKRRERDRGKNRSSSRNRNRGRHNSSRDRSQRDRNQREHGGGGSGRKRDSSRDKRDRSRDKDRHRRPTKKSNSRSRSPSRSGGHRRR